MSLFRFGEFELDEQTLELRKNGQLTRIQQQPARVLAFLLSHRGSLVTREQIRIAIWGEETFVDFEQGLNFCIRQIRLALNDDVQKPAYVETLPRLGYRFVAEINAPADGEKRNGKQPVRIGIVPFDDLARGSEDYFGAGLTEDMISALSRINPALLKVISLPKLAGGDFSVANKSELPGEFDKLQRQFDLDYLLRGSVRRSAAKVRIAVQLHDVRDRSVLWSETFDRPSADMLAVQEEIARQVSQSLALELFPSATVGARRYSRSSEAYDAYLRGRFLWHKMTPNSVRRSIDYFNEALSIDAKFAPAHAGLADCYAQMGSIRVGQMKPRVALEQARTHLKQALDLDETLAEAHCTLGLIKSWYDLDWTGAEREFQGALALDPSQMTALLWQSLLLSAEGRHDEAIASVQRAREMDPLSVSANLYLGVAQTHGGRQDLAIRQFQRCIELDPAYYRTYMFQGRCFNWLKRFDEALATLQKALALEAENLECLAFLASAFAGNGNKRRSLELLKRLQAAEERTEPAILVANVYAQLGMEREMFEWLERAIEAKSTPIYLMVLNHEFHPYRGDSRFRSLLASVGLSGSLPA